MADKIRILMGDDEADLCTLVKTNLEEGGEFEVTTTTNALDVERLSRELKPDLLILDNIMPGKKGSDIIKALKKDDTAKNIPIVMVSGKGEMVYSKKKDQFQWLPNNPMAQSRGDIIEGKDAQVLAKGYGADDYISKPFTTELLIEVIREVLKKKAEEKKEKEDI